MNQIKKLRFLRYVMGSFAISIASHANYDGPRVDYNFTNQKPSEFLICEQDRFNVSLDVYKACSKAQNSAESFAERFGSQEGTIEGYLRGYAWGLHKMISAYENDGSEMQRGANNVLSLGQYFEIAVSAASDKARTDGTPKGKSDARLRFRNAVDTGRVPSREIRVTPPVYRGERNAYQKYVLNGNPLLDANRILREDSSLGNIPVFGSLGSTTLNEREYISPYHYWYSNTDSRGRMTNAGVYRFETRHWDNGQAAFMVWKDRSADNIGINYYENLVTTGQRAPSINNPDGTVVPGKLLSEMYKEAFEKSYEYWVNYYFSRSFQQQVNMGQVAGENLGVQVGKRVAYEKGLANAFDVKFKESGEQTYREEYLISYTDAFNFTYDDYAKNPKLTLDLKGIIGEVNDGIIQPGERIRVKFKIVNAGGVNSPISAALTGDVENSRRASGLSINALSSKTYTTDFIAQVDPRLQPRENARITLIVNGDLRDSLNQTVNNLVEIVSKQTELDILSGTGQFAITAENLSTEDTPGAVQAELLLDGKTYKADAGRLFAGQTKQIVLTFRGLNPVKLIKSNYEATVVLRHNERKVDEFNKTLESKDPVGDSIGYFDELANETAYLPARTTRKTQSDEMIDFIVNANKSEVGRNSKRGGRNMYRKDPLTTIPGKVADQYSSRTQSQKSKDLYDQLAVILIKQSKKFKSFLGIAPKRKHYRKLIRSFAKNPKLK